MLDAGYPTPKQEKIVPLQNNVASLLYVVVCCSPEYQNFDKKFITEMTLVSRKYLMHVVPLEDPIGLLCVVPIIFTQFRMN